jgi:hypothetical protein
MNDDHSLWATFFLNMGSTSKRATESQYWPWSQGNAAIQTVRGTLVVGSVRIALL